MYTGNTRRMVLNRSNAFVIVGKINVFILYILGKQGEWLQVVNFFNMAYNLSFI